MSPLFLSYLAGQLGAGHCVGRRNFLQGSAALLPHGLSASLAAGIFAGYAPSAHALPERTLAFPRDHGAHPDFATEWWYITGYASAASAKGEPRDFGFQVTFFRKTIPATQGMASKFAAKHIVFAHAALTDVQGKKLHHDQRIARTGFGIAQPSEATTDVKLRDWTLKRLADGSYESRISARDLCVWLGCLRFDFNNRGSLDHAHRTPVTQLESDQEDRRQPGDPHRDQRPAAVHAEAEDLDRQPRQ